MARQQTIPGTERPEHPELVELHEALLDLRAETKAMKFKRDTKEQELIQAMRASKVKVHVYTDETGTKRQFSVDDKIQLKSRKLPADEDKPTLPKHNGANGEAHPGLIKQAEAEQANEANVEVDSEGNVVVPDKQAPKAKRGGKRKAN